MPDLLTTIFGGWETYQGHLITSLTPLTAEQLALRPADHLRSIGEIGDHIAVGRARWFHYALNEGSPATAPLLKDRGAGAPAPTASELVSAIEATWREINLAVARWTPEEAAQPFVVMRGGQDRTVSRNWVIWHLLEHDLHHGGELALLLGLHGLATPDL